MTASGAPPREPRNDTAVFLMYEGDGAWRESVTEGDITIGQTVNEEVLRLLGHVFGDQVDWYERGIAFFEMTRREPPEFTIVASPAELVRIIDAATRVFHHEIIKVYSSKD